MSAPPGPLTVPCCRCGLLIPLATIRLHPHSAVTDWYCAPCLDYVILYGTSAPKEGP